MRVFYQNSVAENQLKEAGLFEVAKILGYVRYKGGKPCVNGAILSGIGQDGKAAGFGFSMVKALVIHRLNEFKSREN